MKDFNGADIIDLAEDAVKEQLKFLADRFVIQLTTDKDYICFAMNGRKFKRIKNESDELIFKRAKSENISYLKKTLAEKWIREEIGCNKSDSRQKGLQ